MSLKKYGEALQSKIAEIREEHPEVAQREEAQAARKRKISRRLSQSRYFFRLSKASHVAIFCAIFCNGFYHLLYVFEHTSLLFLPRFLMVCF